jgi:hypothetical protein
MSMLDRVFVGRKKESEISFIKPPSSSGVNPNLREILDRVEAIEQRLDVIEGVIEQNQRNRKNVARYQRKYPMAKKHRKELLKKERDRILRMK